MGQIENNPRFSIAKNKASEILFFQEKNNFPIDLKNIKLLGINIIVCSFKEYSIIVKVPIEKVTLNGKYKDGYTLPNIRPNVSIILYNDEIETQGRIRWTLAHELGHIVLGHLTQSHVNEIEANCFASQLLLPSCILKELMKKGADTSQSYIMKKFGLSKEAADNYKKKLDRNMSVEYVSEYDDIILEKNKEFIYDETKHSKRYIEDEMYELDKTRENWMYDR